MLTSLGNKTYFERLKKQADKLTLDSKQFILTVRFACNTNSSNFFRQMYHGVSKKKATGDTASAIGDNDNIPLLRSIQFIQIDIVHRRLQGGGHAPPPKA